MADLPGKSTYVVIGGGVHGLSTAYLQQVRDYSALKAGLAFVPMTAVLFAMVQVVPRLVPRIGTARLLAAGVLVALVAMAWLSRISASTQYFPQIALPLVLLGLGAGIAFIPLTSRGIAGVEPGDSGAASGLVNVFHQVGGALRAIFADWNGEGIEAVLHERQGGWAETMKTVENLAKLARSKGVRIFEGVEVMGIDLHDGLVHSVETSAGSIETDLLVVGAGPWSGHVWRMLGLPPEVKVARKDKPTSPVGDSPRIEGDGNGAAYETKPIVTYWKLQEGDYWLDDVELTTADGEPPVVHLDHVVPLRSDRDGHIIEDGAWGIYYKLGRRGFGVQGGDQARHRRGARALRRAARSRRRRRVHRLLHGRPRLGARALPRQVRRVAHGPARRHRRVHAGQLPGCRLRAPERIPDHGLEPRLQDDRDGQARRPRHRRRRRKPARRIQAVEVRAGRDARGLALAVPVELTP